MVAVEPSGSPCPMEYCIQRTERTYLVQMMVQLWCVFLTDWSCIYTTTSSIKCQWNKQYALISYLVLTVVIAALEGGGKLM